VNAELLQAVGAADLVLREAVVVADLVPTLLPMCPSPSNCEPIWPISPLNISSLYINAWVPNGPPVGPPGIVIDTWRAPNSGMPVSSTWLSG
jgi:hypothetical protein